MERDRLTKLVQDAASVERSDLADLEDLTKRFPWFAGAQILRSTGVSKAGEVLADEALRDAAAHVPSRSILFDVVHRSTMAPKPVDPKAESPLPDEPARVVPVSGPTEAMHTGTVLVDTVDPEPVEAGATLVLPTEKAAEPVAAAAEVNPQAPLPTPTHEAGEEHVVLQALDELVERSEQAARSPGDDPLERQILESALVSAYDLTWTHEPPVRSDRPVRVEPVEDPITFPPQGMLVPQAPLAHRPAITKHGKYSFTAWLEADDLPLPSAARPKPQEGSIPAAISDWVRSTPLEPEDQEELPRTTPKRALKPLPEDPMANSDLIDRFIKQQVPAAQVKTAFFTPQQAAKRSLEDKAGLVTETLARVYAKQGDLPKAIDTYKRLALKYPEKSAYFAALQKELEGQLNK